ncbi:MFS transporter [Mesorhizobium sp. B2-3-5]|uniref:MFS transporter n=1 Tax=Mesorhizobium sp. B2-3-5 TaxID=2589958 RepID=UPI0015E32F0D|nr:MFS transporter [Mesorhizobium sp. B2-3-5]
MSALIQPPQSGLAQSKGRVLAVTFVLALGYVMAMLDATAVNVALNTIKAEFGAPLASLVWVVDAYTLSFAALLLLGGAMADRLGAKRTYMIGLVWFIAASAFCGLAPSTDLLVVARLLQGLGAALFMPSSMSLITESFPERVQRAKQISIWGAVVGAAAGAGPLVGGLLVSLFGWRSIFYLNIPIGILAIVLSAMLLRPSSTRSRRFSALSHALIMVTLGALSFVLIEGPVLGWLMSLQIQLASLVAAAALAMLVFRELRSGSPVVPIVLARNARFWAFNGMGFMVNFTLFGQIFVLSLYLQQTRGEGPLATGLYMLPLMALITVMNIVSGYVAARFGIVRVLTTGFLLSSAGCLLTALLGVEGPRWMSAMTIALCNAGFGLAIPSVIVAIMQEAGQQNANIGAATLNANRQIGSLAGVAAMGIVLHWVGDWNIGTRLAFLSFGACMATAAVLVFWPKSGHDRQPVGSSEPMAPASE